MECATQEMGRIRTHISKQVFFPVGSFKHHSTPQALNLIVLLICKNNSGQCVQSRSAAACESGNPRNEHICGRPLGLRFNRRTGDLYIADAYLGLMRVGPEGGQATMLVNEVDGVPLRFTNDLDVASDGSVYFTDSSSKYQRRFRAQLSTASIYGLHVFRAGLMQYVHNKVLCCSAAGTSSCWYCLGTTQGGL